ncbi:MAG: hypothetical protein LBG80_09845 [Bacteroidales bacterium]|jgi:hypothetical protein|nr:hypothetical protein [Bacteroidales bacterium]
MKKLNNISRTEGFPITAEVLETLNNSDIFDYIMGELNIKGVRNAYTFINSYLYCLYFNSNGLASLWKCEVSTDTILAAAEKNNRNKYKLVFENKEIDISKSDGTQVYEKAITEKLVKFVSTNDSSGETKYMIKELLGLDTIEDTINGILSSIEAGKLNKLDNFSVFIPFEVGYSRNSGYMKVNSLSQLEVNLSINIPITKSYLANTAYSFGNLSGLFSASFSVDLFSDLVFATFSGYVLKEDGARIPVVVGIDNNEIYNGLIWFTSNIAITRGVSLVFSGTIQLK